MWCFINDNTNVRVSRSAIHGVGVTCINPDGIPEGTNPFEIHGARITDRTISFTSREIDALKLHVGEHVKKFFLPVDDMYSLPAEGLNTMDASFYMNSAHLFGKRGDGISDVSERAANMSLGMNIDHHGYTVCCSTTSIKYGEELVFPYHIESLGRTVGVFGSEGSGVQHANRVVAEHVCKGCLDPVTTPGKEFIVTGCSCAPMCKDCAVKWYLKRLEIHFTPILSAQVDGHDLQNQWKLNIVCKCEVCTHSCDDKDFMDLLKKAGKKTSPKLQKVLKHDKEQIPTALSIKKVDKKISDAHDVQGDKGVGNYRASARWDTESFRGIGAAPSRRRSSATSQLGAQLVPLGKRKRSQLAGSDKGKKLLVWVEPSGKKGKWVRGKAIEFVSANERNREAHQNQGNAVYSGPQRTRGMYKFQCATYERPHGELTLEDYYSEDDTTIKVSKW